jgi:mono/diheme cytochrome c family protein
MFPKAGLVRCGIFAVCGLAFGQEFRPQIPRAWDDSEVARFELPLAVRDRSPRYMSAKEYYSLKVRPIYRSYPVYAPGREPAGYRDSLLQKEPEIIFDSSKLHTKEDWIRAGQVVFESQTVFRPAPPEPSVDELLPVAKNGVLPPFRPGGQYIVRKKGILEVGSNACADCHTRVMPDGSFFQGAQGITARPTSEDALRRMRDSNAASFANQVEREWVLFGAPWILGKDAFVQWLTRDEMSRQLAANRPGVFARQGTSRSHPVRIPSLVGIQDLKYLDSTGLVRQRSIADLMRYAIINMGLDTLAYYGDFQPSSKPTVFTAEEGTRYSDEQLYAMALYLYSLKPPPNPNPSDDLASAGQRIFQQQGCVGCHPAPLYTNNKLTPAAGFKVPEDLRQTEDILNISVGTDPTVALKTRRGTGFYKVPSLRGVWFRNGFGHAGQADTLEEWLDPLRLKDDYVPRGFHVGRGPIKGHEFGLRIAPEERQALIAFLKTL